jgi:hypothetical protein
MERWLRGSLLLDSHFTPFCSAFETHVEGSHRSIERRRSSASADASGYVLPASPVSK